MSNGFARAPGILIAAAGNISKGQAISSVDFIVDTGLTDDAP